MDQGTETGTVPAYHLRYLRVNNGFFERIAFVDISMNPETRRLIRVQPSDVAETARVFDLLLGDNLQGRKDHIAENGFKYLEMADIS